MFVFFIFLSLFHHQSSPVRPFFLFPFVALVVAVSVVVVVGVGVLLEVEHLAALGAARLGVDLGVPPDGLVSLVVGACFFFLGGGDI